MFGNPEWTYNLLQRSDTVLDFLRKQALEASLPRAISKHLFRTGSFDSLDTATGDSVLDAPNCCPLYDSTMLCVMENFVEGFCIGGGISTAVSCLPPLFKGRIKVALRNVPTLYNLRVAVFFGTLMTVCNTLLHLRRCRRGGSKPVSEERSFRLMVSLLSGICISTLPRGVRRFVVYMLFTRALEVMIRRRRASQETNKEVEVFSSHETVALTMASMSVITTTWFGWPHLINPGYLHFLDNISNIKKSEFRDVGKVMLGACAGRPDLQYVHDSKQTCRVFHAESEACPRFIARVFLTSFIKHTIPFYIKIYQIPLLFTLIKRRGRIDTRVVIHFTKRVGRSGIFLAVLNTLVGGTICTISNQRSIPQLVSMPLSGAVSGASLYIEDPARRLELALYMFGQALQMISNAYVANGYWTHPRMDIFVSTFSAMTLMNTFWEREEEGKINVLRGGYSQLLGKILDTHEKRHEFRIWS
jgi:hypothetical protein